MYNLKSGDGGAFPALDLGEVGVYVCVGVCVRKEGRKEGGKEGRCVAWSGLVWSGRAFVLCCDVL